MYVLSILAADETKSGGSILGILPLLLIPVAMYFLMIRPQRRRQYTQHSKHNFGRAVDFRVLGVPNRVARDFRLDQSSNGGSAFCSTVRTRLSAV